MPRRNFSKAIKVAVVKRATRCGTGETAGRVVYCESCGLPAKKWQIDHKRADGLLGEPTIENAELICDVCFGIKNPDDTRKIAKAKRREALAIGAHSPKQSIPNRGFPKSDKPNRIEKLPLPARIRDIFGRALS